MKNLKRLGAAGFAGALVMAGVLTGAQPSFADAADVTVVANSNYATNSCSTNHTVSVSGSFSAGDVAFVVVGQALNSAPPTPSDNNSTTYSLDKSVGTSVSSAPKRVGIFRGTLGSATSGLQVTEGCNGSYNVMGILVVRPASGKTVALDQSGGQYGVGAPSVHVNAQTGGNPSADHELVIVGHFSREIANVSGSGSDCWDGSSYVPAPCSLTWNGPSGVLSAGTITTGNNVASGTEDTSTSTYVSSDYTFTRSGGNVSVTSAITTYTVS